MILGAKIESYICLNYLLKTVYIDNHDLYLKHTKDLLILKD